MIVACRASWRVLFGLSERSASLVCRSSSAGVAAVDVAALVGAAESYVDVVVACLEREGNGCAAGSARAEGQVRLEADDTIGR